MANIETAVENIYTVNWSTTRGLNWGTYENKQKLYMEIPINKEQFELPALAFFAFKNNNVSNKDAIVVNLRTQDRTPYYVTINRYMCDVLLQDFKNTELIKLRVKQSDNSFYDYYGTYGAVFDRNFKPIMMCSWVIEKIHDNEENPLYRFVRPILRIAPFCFIDKADSMQRFIANKMPALVLANPMRGCVRGNKFETCPRMPVQVVIEECPFVLKRASTPSFSTTNEELLKSVINHIDEVIDEN